MKKAHIATKIVILVLVLAVPGFLYYLLVTLGKNHYHALNIFGPKQLAATSHKVHGKVIPDTIYHKLDNFNLTDQDGKPVTLSSFDGKIFVVSFFYSNCPSVCGTINSNIAKIAEGFKAEKLVEFVSITVDPARDSPAVLKAYSSQYNAVAPKWRFLTGDISTIYNLAHKGFFVDAIQSSKTSFIYSNQVMLVDEEKRIRGYYKGADATDVDRLNSEIKVLLSGEIMANDVPEY